MLEIIWSDEQVLNLNPLQVCYGLMPLQDSENQNKTFKSLQN